MITDGTQSIDTDAVTMVRSGWTRVRQSVSPIFRAEEGVRHFAILSDESDDDLVQGQAKSSRRGNLYDRIAT